MSPDAGAGRWIRAAGAVLWRPTDTTVEVALIHRPRYDDWTLPKGKLDRGETELAAAVREVAEETGSDATVGRRLHRVSYSMPDAGVDQKTVQFWAMRHVGGEFVPNAEADELRWMPPAQARTTLSYDTDRAVLDSLDPLPDSFVVLVRHAKAGKRSEWHADDRNRPLEPAGERQSAALAGVLRHFGVTRVVSADLVRCRQTVEPLARALGLAVEESAAFADRVATGEGGTDEAVRAVCALAEPGSVNVVCSQGETIPMLVAVLTARRSVKTRKGAYWVLGFSGGTVVSADAYGPAGG